MMGEGRRVFVFAALEETNGHGPSPDTGQLHVAPLTLDASSTRSRV
jgi:hypothetical protein